MYESASKHYHIQNPNMKYVFPIQTPRFKTRNLGDWYAQSISTKQPLSGEQVTVFPDTEIGDSISRCVQV